MKQWTLPPAQQQIELVEIIQKAIIQCVKAKTALDQVKQGKEDFIQDYYNRGEKLELSIRGKSWAICVR